jgi:hypothetical protein
MSVVSDKRADWVDGLIIADLWLCAENLAIVDHLDIY